MRLLAARLLLGVVVLVCAEVFSGASLVQGLWHPWVWLVTYWLYFAHFFVFTSLAVVTGRTSLGSCYLWGVLFGLYESWITKVIWHGFGGDGEMALGSVGPFGFAEFSMVVFFHPIASFILPLAAACVLCPALRYWFPGVTWLIGSSRWARVAQAGLILAFAPCMAINSGGALNLAANACLLAAVLLLLWWLARPALQVVYADALVLFSFRGFLGLCGYLALLYSVTYFLFRMDGLPAPGVQVLTLGFYAIAIAGLRWHGPRQPGFWPVCETVPRERRFLGKWLALLLLAAFLLTPFRSSPVVYLLLIVNFAVWTPLGLVLTGRALLSR